MSDYTIIKRYETSRVMPDYVGDPIVEACGGERGFPFTLRLGGTDYYNQEQDLDVAQATQLRDLLNEWLGTQ